MLTPLLLVSRDANSRNLMLRVSTVLFQFPDLTVVMGVRAWARGCSVVVLWMCSEAAYGVLGSHQHVAMKF